MKLKTIFSILRSQNVFDLIRFMKDWRSLVRMHFLHAAIQSGLLDSLKSPCSKKDLIQKLNVNRPELLDAILEVGLSLKELSIRNGMYRVKGKRSLFLMGSDGDVLSAFIEANVTYYNATYRHFADRLKGAPLADYLQEFGEVIARFSRMAEPYVRHFIGDILKGKAAVRMLDIGCGTGVYLRSAFEMNPNTSGIGIDVDENVVMQARENLNHWDINDQFKVVAGDIRTPPSEISGLFDLITLNNIVYYFPVKERTNLFQSLRKLLSPDGAIAIISYFQSEGKDLAAANLNIVTSSLLDCTPLPDLNEIKSHLSEAGLQRIQATKLIPKSAFFGVVARQS
jgi:SAM-dependent methyltransferase